jgi:hypothetical protein
MENLNKTNYFTTEWLEKYPKASKLFCTWIDTYKARVNWDQLFYLNREVGTADAPKFHDLPIEFQIGIIGKFCVENKEVPHYFLSASSLRGDNMFEIKSLIKTLNDIFDLTEIELHDKGV